jgi:hypothetical protein
MEGEAQKMKTLKLHPKQVCIALFVVCAFFNVFTSFRTPLSDFGNYYYGAKLVKEEIPATKLNEVLFFNQYAEQNGGQGLFLDHCTVSPQSVLIYQPCTLTDNPQLAKSLFNWFGIILFIFSLNRFLRKYPVEFDWKLCIVFISALIPIYYNILFGQTYLVITALVLETILNAEKLKWVSGLCLAIAIALKISPAILLVWLISEKKFGIIAWTIGFWLTITILSALMFAGMQDQLIIFYTEAMPRMMNGFVSDPYSSSFQGFIVFLRKLMLPDAILNPGALINGSELLVQLINTIFFIVISVLLVGGWKKELEWKRKILLLLLLVNITSGYTSTYSLLLFLPFVSFGNTMRDWIKVMCYAVIFVFPPRIFDGYSPFLEEYKLWIFIGLFVMECLPRFSFRKLEKPQLMVGAILLGMIIFKFSNRPEVLPLSYYRTDLIKQKYVLEAFPANGNVKYLSYADGKFREYNVPVGDWRVEWDSLVVVHGVNMKIVGSNAENILVLSDYHRGPGLFHLFTISRAGMKAIINQ